MVELLNADLDEITKIKEISNSGDDGPVLMLNLNRYVPEAGYPNGDLYKDFIAVVAKIVAGVGGKILWRTSVHGHVVGDQVIHEALGIWYPTHQAFLNLTTSPDFAENMRLRSLVLAEASLLRCDDY